MSAKRTLRRRSPSVLEFAVVGILLVGLLFTIVYWFLTVKRGPFPEGTVPKTVIIAVYKGRIPCADCPGIDATIKFFRDDTFEEIYVYEGRNTTSTVRGSWNIQKGTPSNPSSWVYAITPWGQTNAQFYLVEESQLIPLSSDLGPIPAPYNAPLTKQ